MTSIDVIHSPFKTPADMPMEATAARGIVDTIAMTPAYLAHLRGKGHLLIQPAAGHDAGEDEYHRRDPH